MTSWAVACSTRSEHSRRGGGHRLFEEDVESTLDQCGCRTGVKVGREQDMNHVEAVLVILEHCVERLITSADAMAFAERLSSRLVLVADRTRAKRLGSCSMPWRASRQYSRCPGSQREPVGRLSSFARFSISPGGGVGPSVRFSLDRRLSGGDGATVFDDRASSAGEPPKPVPDYPHRMGKLGQDDPGCIEAARPPSGQPRWIA